MADYDFIAIGDAVVDDFIRLKEAEVHCDINKENCTICMRFGDKIPFESSTVVYGVGNSANGAIAATRLGLKAAYVTNIGKDINGDKIIEYYKTQGLDSSFVTQHEGIPTNYHYVLWFLDERTILIKHHDYPRAFPKGLPEPKTLYFSSLGENTEKYHDDIAEYAKARPNMLFVFQPGTFQMKMGTEKLSRIYKRADLYVLNKEEAARVLGLPREEHDPKMLAEKLHELGPKTVIITNGPDGVYALENGTNFFHVPMFPDPKPPLQRTGAGDALASTTAAYLTMGYSLKDAITHGTVNAAYVVQDIGAQRGLLTKEKLESILKGV